MEIYGTIGPSCADPGILREMVSLGMTGIRMNLSHGALKEHEDWLELIHQAGIKDLLIDLQGPELRIGEVKRPAILQQGDRLVLKNKSQQKEIRDHDAGKEWSMLSMITVPDALIAAAGPGQLFLIDDGKIEIQAEDIREDLIICRIIRGGELLSRKSIAAPGLTINAPTLTEEDLCNLQNAKNYGVTGVMLPFVRGKKDICNLKKALKACGAENIRIFAKIENQLGMNTLLDFVKDVDQVVIARGDLGNAMPLWELPGCQKRLAAICREAGTDFMVVTQMLDSMQEREVPTRAEVSDIYNAVMDGAASVMLTGETAAGRYPAEAIRYLVNTALAACGDRNRRIKNKKSKNE